MSKAENVSTLIRYERDKTITKTFHLAVSYITLMDENDDCPYCPMEGSIQCVKNCMPPAKSNYKEDRTICQDWIELYFLNKAKDNVSE